MKMLLPVVLLTGCMAARAEEMAFGDTAVRSVSRAQFVEDVQHLRAVVAACNADAKACDAKQVGDDERVDAGQPDAFELHWGWLRSALHTSQTAKAEDRARYMCEAEAQLNAMSKEAGGTARDDGFAKARGAANDVLRAPEFDNAVGPTWWDRKLAQIQNLIYRLFNGVSDLGTMAPWIGTLLEWLLFVTAAVGLLIFVLRAVARQRMRLALGQSAPAATAWAREAADWAQQADAHAAAADWREAVHCLYWAAIVLLEDRRAWRHNPTRTPREYIRLLAPGSAQQKGLRGLTWLFERLWYGQRETTAEDYRLAQQCFRQLESGDADAAVGVRPAVGPTGATA